jgi:Tfp pilus assembly protein PilO
MKAVYKKYFGVVALIWAGCFILFLLAYMFLLLPQKRSRKQIEKKFLEVKQTYNRTSGAAKDEVQAQLNRQIEDLRNRLEQFVIDSGESANLTFDISQIANENMVTSFSIRSKDRPGTLADSNYDHICEKQIRVSFTAGFSQFAGFLNALERNRPVLFVDKFMITRSEGDSSGHQVDMDLAVFAGKRQDS